MKLLRTLLACAWMVAYCGCGIFDLAPEIEVVNQTGAMLEVLAAPCGTELVLFAMLEDGRSHTQGVSAGCWRLEGWTDDWRAGVSEVTTRDGNTQRVVFRPEQTP